jgi:hypothetical protein
MATGEGLSVKDAEKLVAWVREAANELEKAHAFLDALGIPRGLSDADCTLAARISLLAGTPSNWTAETPNGGEWSHDTEDYFVDGNR